MKLSTTVWLCAAGAIACSHASRPQTASTSAAPMSAEPTATARVETAQVSESAPIASGIPTNAPPLASPAAAGHDETEVTLTPASGAGSPRAASAQLMPSDSARDKAESAQDQESIREIRALLASDRQLAPSARQVTIVARNGRVWLRGQVNTAEQRAAIERAARQAAGVIDVNNELAVME